MNPYCTAHILCSQLLLFQFACAYMCVFICELVYHIGPWSRVVTVLSCRGECSQADPRLSTWRDTDQLLAVRGGGVFMDEATCKAAGEEAWRQIDHPLSSAFQELRPRGGWRHGSIFWIVAQSQYRVCGVELQGGGASTARGLQRLQ